jgi:hypothetical protein
MGQCPHGRRRMNQAQEAIEKVIADLGDNPLTPQSALLIGLMILRGGRASKEDLYGDVDAWEAEHGEMTIEKIREWAATLDIECGLVEPALERHAEEAKAAGWFKGPPGPPAPQ